MKNYRAVLVLAVSLLILFLIYISLLYYEGGTAGRSVLVRVSPGDSFTDIKEQLESRGLLEHPSVFRWAAYLTGREGKIKVGEYRFDGSESASSILAKLTAGAVDYRRVIIPEGLMLTEIAAVTARRTGIDSVRFVELASDRGLIDSLGFRGETLEGYLFPDTYLITWPFAPREIIVQMVRRFRDVYEREATGAADSAGMSRLEVVTLASIIQAEAGYDGEMRKISAVYHNRLNKGMRLEADPTVAYALGGIRRKLWYKDLRVDSPYNTYRYRGLPPGPICSPGSTALSAAVRPEPGFDAYYFVADGSGGHIFSRTLRQHNRAKREIKNGNVREGITTDE